MRVSIEDHLAQHETRTFVDVQTQPVARFNHVVHVHFRIAMFSIEHFEKKREIVRARRTQSEIFDRSDLLFQTEAQVLVRERLLAAKFDDAGPLGAFLLLLHDGPPRLLLLFWSHNINGALRCDLKSEDRHTQREEDAVSHVSENESDISVSLENPRELRRHQ